MTSEQRNINEKEPASQSPTELEHNISRINRKVKKSRLKPGAPAQHNIPRVRPASESPTRSPHGWGHFFPGHGFGSLTSPPPVRCLSQHVHHLADRNRSWNGPRGRPEETRRRRDDDASVTKTRKEMQHGDGSDRRCCGSVSTPPLSSKVGVGAMRYDEPYRVPAGRF